MSRDERPTARLVGLDTGGTKTHIAVIDTDGRRHDSVVSSARWRTHDALFNADDARRLAELVISVCPATQQTVTVLGAHGCDTDAALNAVAAHMRAALPGVILARNDAEILGAAAGHARSIQLIVGTGSIVTGRNERGRLLVVGGYGWHVDDIGSAPGLVRDALAAVVNRDRHGQPPGVLARTLMQSYGAATVRDLAYASAVDFGPTGLGAHCPAVFAAAQDGSRLAHRLIAAAARTLAEQVQLGSAWGMEGEVVVAAGGVITHQHDYAQMVGEELAAREPRLSFVVLDADPVEGALRLASRQASAH